MARLTLFENATVLTMVPDGPVASALAVRDGRVAAVGSAEALRGLRAEAQEVVDLAGRTILPGFIDPHNHFAVGALETFYDQGAPAIPLPPELRCRPFRSLSAGGVRQAFSSDYPCGSVAPLLGIAAAVTRRDREGRVADPEEAMSVEQALAAYTIEAARACGLEREAGSLAVGKRADLVVLDGNPLAVAPDALAGLRVVETRLAGRPVWP